MREGSKGENRYKDRRGVQKSRKEEQTATALPIKPNEAVCLKKGRGEKGMR